MIQSRPTDRWALAGDPSAFTFDVLDHGYVALERIEGTELDVVNAARVSYGKRSEELTDADRGLLGFLIRERHGSPAEMVGMLVRMRLPIFVMREHVRHRIASLNEMSGRYVELPELWYVPRPEDVRVRVGKPGHYTYERADIELARITAEHIEMMSASAFESYRTMLDAGIAPEVARVILPVNTYTEIWWRINLRSLMNYVSLRNAPTAQWEIQQYAGPMEAIFEAHWPTIHAAFVENGRVAP